MSPKKQVDFITRVSKSKLGLDGMKIIVLCDKSKTEEEKTKINFDIIGKQMLEKVNGDYIIKKYNIDCKDENQTKKIGELLRQERIKWIIN